MVIYGPNGVGKSSVIDGIEFALTGASSLFPETRLGVNWDSASPHVSHGDGYVVISLQDGSNTGSIDTRKTRSEQDALAGAWLDLAEQSNFVLRRHMLLRFIQEQPRGRYDLLAPFCNLGKFAAFELALKTVSDQAESDRVSRVSEKDSQEQRVRRVFGMTPDQSVEEGVLLTKLNETLAQVDLKGCSMDELEARSKEITDRLGGSDRSSRIANLGGLKGQVSRLGTVGDYSAPLQALFESAQTLESEIAGRTQDILTDFLAAGKTAIEDAGLTSCPLCEQPIEKDAVLARLTERIKADERVRAAQTTFNSRCKGVTQSLSRLGTAMTDFKDSWSQNVSATFPDEYERTITWLQDMLTILSEEKVVASCIGDMIAQSKGCVGSHEGVAKQLDQLIESEGGGTQRVLLQDASEMVSFLKDSWSPYKENARRLEEANARKGTADRLYAHAIEARKAAVQSAFDAVANTANTFYEQIHPGESIATSKLEVREHGQGSVNLTTVFHGHEENPMLHFSESHLDTLGLCYFLALRKHEATEHPEFKVLILDDVLHSVDADHRTRVAAMLRAEFADHQVIVATHDEHFYDALRRSFGNGQVTYQKILNWDIERGPVLGDPATDLDVILDAAQYDSRRPDDLAGAGGRLFEWMLKRLDERLQIPVPARFERKHDIGNLWPPLCAKLKKQQGFMAAHGQLVTDLENSAWIRNATGAHDDESASGVTPSEIREFATSLAALYEAMHCDTCHEFVAKFPDGSWRCDCANGLVYESTSPAQS